jgi:hypothetical protein
MKTFEWSELIERLKHHRERLNITKPEMIAYIKQKYGRSFHNLEDYEIYNIGVTMAKCENKKDLII